MYVAEVNEDGGLLNEDSWSPTLDARLGCTPWVRQIVI